MFSGAGTDVTVVAVVEFSTSVFTPFSGIADILGLGLGTNDVSTADTFDRLPLLLLLLALLLPVLVLLFAQLLLLLLLLDTATLTAGTKVLLLLLLLMVLEETEEGVAFDEILDRVIVGALVLDGTTDILVAVVDAEEEGDGTTVEGVALRDGVAFAGAGLVDTGAVVEVAVVLLLSVVEAVVVTDRADGDDSEPAASFSCSVSSFTFASVPSAGPGSVEFTFDVLLLSFVVLLILPLLLLLLLVVLVILLILVAVVDVVVAALAEDTVAAAASGGDAADVVTVLVTGAVATDDTVAVVFVVDALLHTAGVVLILPALQLLLLLLLLLLLVLFEDEFVETLDAELFPIELFVEFAARSRPTVFCCCSRCSLVVTPVVSASTMHCVGF